MIIFLFELFALFCICGIAAAMLKQVSTGKRSNGRVITARIFLILFTVINTTLLFVLIAIAKINVGQLNLYDNYAVSIGMGVVVAFIVSIASVAIPVRGRDVAVDKVDKTDVSHVQYLNI